MSEYLKQIEVVIKSDVIESLKIEAIKEICMAYDVNQRNKLRDEVSRLYDSTSLGIDRMAII